VGPNVHPNVSTEFEEIEGSDDHFAQAVRELNKLGIEARYGKWLVTGRPNIVLINPFSAFSKLADIKYLVWEHHHIDLPGNDGLLDQVIAFGHVVKLFFELLSEITGKKKRIIGHFHEWMAGIPIPELRREKIPVSVVFTTHATLLGRYLAMNDPEFYNHLPFFNWLDEAKNFNIEASVRIERAAAHGCHTLTTVSEVTSRECTYLLGRSPDVVTPNGLNIQRYSLQHEFQNLHREYKQKIHQFTIAHFFHSYTFDLDNTLYFFTSGRFEFRNKGFGLTLEALARLNYLMQKNKVDKTVIMFFITRQPYHSINPGILHSRGLIEELRQTCIAIEKQVGERLFYAAAGIPDSRLPLLNDFVDDYWRLRFRRTLQSWKTTELPKIVTHNLVNDTDDPILVFLRSANMVNQKSDRVKIVYHPDFITSTNPLWGMEYDQFVRGCHLGIFPSYYEPWGYTPLESIARGVPAVTSNLSGFGDYVLKTIPNADEKGLFVIDKINRTFDQSAQQLANLLFEFVQKDRRERVDLRYRSEQQAINFDWEQLNKYYERAYNLSLQRA
jgi:glycogen(starch) synthase